MNRKDIALQIFTDNKSAMQQFITGFINDMIDEEIPYHTDGSCRQDCVRISS